MSLNRGTSIGTPKVFVDYISYLRAVNAIDSYEGQANVWDMNPSRTISLEQDEEATINFNVDDDPDVVSLLSASSYLAVLGQDVAPNSFSAKFGNQEISQIPSSIYAPVSQSQEYAGYTIFNPKMPLSGLKDSFTFSTNKDCNIGCVSIGRSFTFPNAPDLDVKYSLSHEGISSKRTLSGRDVVNINYYKAPNWVGRRPWTSGQSDENYSKTGYNGRRTWQVKFSYVDHTNMMPLNTNENFLFDKPSSGLFLSISPATEDIMANFLSLTMNGTLKFIFQPNKDEDQFSMCRLAKNKTTITQVAHKTYDVSFTFVEAW
tara:strand:+ start:2768 stop:3718 length:951 start_codon:yes stop_codon:yes gene_type:complete